MTSAHTAALLARLPDGDTEIYFHPATADTFAGSAESYRYTDELAALTAAEVLAAAEKSGAVRGGFLELGAT